MMMARCKLKHVAKILKDFNLLINICCVIDCNKLLPSGISKHSPGMFRRKVLNWH